MTVNIFGSNWTIVEDCDENDLFEQNCVGFCDQTSRTIVLKKLSDKELLGIGDIEQLRKYTLRHELIHAALFECGMGDNWMRVPMGHDETSVDWLAFKAPQLYQIFRDANAI